jgi:Tol biopolymer transport system component
MHVRRLVFALTAVTVTAPVLGQHDFTDYEFEQLTFFPFGTAIFEVSLAADTADRVAFRTTGSLDGPNDGGNFEIFLYDRGDDAFTQITDTPFGVGNFEPLLTPTGGAIVFRSAYDHVGDGQGGQFELYEYDVATDVFSRLVNINAGQVTEARISGDGRYVVFRSNFDLTGGNSDGNYEIYRVDRSTGSIDQITDTTVGLRSFPDVSHDGRLVVFDQNNPNNIMLWDAQDGSVTNLTNNPGNLRTEMPQVSDDGRFVCFYSLYAYDPNSAGNGCFVIDRDLGTITRVGPMAIDNDDNEPFTMEMAPDGSAIFFESDGYGDNRQLYRYTIATGQVQRVTTDDALISDAQCSTDASRRYISIADDLTFAYRSEQMELDPNGDNSNNTGGPNFDLYLATLPTCPEDLTGDGFIDQADLGELLASYGQGDGGDIDGDGDTDQADLGALLGVYGQPCP